jgi:hypothetical protein
VTRARFSLIWLGVLTGCGLGFTGCTHYQWGTTGHLVFSTLYVKGVRNTTMAPQLSVTMSNVLRDTFNHDGRVQLVNSPDDADATLEVTITGYTRAVAAVREQDTGLAGKFSITVTATCNLIDNRTHKNLFTAREIQIKQDVFTDNGDPHSSLVSDQLQSEYNSVPLIAEALGKKIVSAVTDVW